jgi:hypothetical protein
METTGGGTAGLTVTLTSSEAESAESLAESRRT